jgi:hypothetical protein
MSFEQGRQIGMHPKQRQKDILTTFNTKKTIATQQPITYLTSISPAF